MRTLQDILDLVKTIVKFLNQVNFDYKNLSSNTFMIESERNQGKISSSNNSNTQNQLVLAAAICLFKKVKYTPSTNEQHVDNFEHCLKQKIH